MTSFIEAFYNSFSSSGPRSGDQSNSKYQSQEKEEPISAYLEMQLLKIAAPKYDLEKFSKEIFSIRKTVGIDIEIKHILPSRKNEERMKEMEEREKTAGDFLDHMFSDTIPFFHDLLVYGSPEIEFYQIKGDKGEITLFNQLCRQMIFSKELQCKIEVIDRRKIPLRKQVKKKIFGGPRSDPDVLDAMFTDDFSSCNPFLHNLILSAY